eukprot:scaffold262300_cov23-Prasinocladus_malaysianus.AAC.1
MLSTTTAVNNQSTYGLTGFGSNGIGIAPGMMGSSSSSMASPAVRDGQSYGALTSSSSGPSWQAQQQPSHQPSSGVPGYAGPTTATPAGAMAM